MVNVVCWRTFVMERASVVCGVPLISSVRLSSQMSIMALGIKLKSDSDLSLSDMDESICSGQLDLTASCQDTPDTETELSSSLVSEFSIASSASNSAALPEVSSGPEDIYEAGNLALSPAKENVCIRCHSKKSSPFLYCKRCFADRKRFFPPRPNIRKRKRMGQISSSTTSKEAICSNSTSDECNSKPTLCGCCMDAPCNGIFIHGDVGHQIFCYRCAHRLWLERKSCPYCNRGISKVVKLFRVDFE